MNKKIAVLGAGSWGTALAVSLSKNKHSLSIWDIDKDHKDSLKEERENLKYLPGVRFDDSIKIADTAEEAVYEADIVLFSAPAQHFRNALDGAMPFLTADMVKKDAVVIDVGITRVEDNSKKNGYALKGDVDFENVAPKCSWITPVPGGVGLMTIVGLLKNTLASAKKEIY